ncbi:MAG: sulfatase-like hydrolase/transferase [Bacteroidales bacterium]|nr:sulfatase-like hydrolase/transferase [Bacteroidales bacterium]
MVKIIIYLSTLLALVSCTRVNDIEKPNIILILADDMGYECLGCNGSLSYNTPVLDDLASSGLRFTNCYAQPLCTPSRVKIMTGKYNYRNYEYFGYLDENELTFGTLFKEAGYATCIAGKWQLNGLSYDLPGYDDNSRPYLFGFDEYCLWQLTVPGNEGSRYADPVIEKNGEMLRPGIEKYGPDIFTDFIIDFVKRRKEQPLFIYYPMVLVHNPFVPTPDSEEWNDPVMKLQQDNKYFSDMVNYTDKLVGRIVTSLKENGIFDKTIVIFTGDNGTNRSIVTETNYGTVRGFKGNTTDAGTRVPLVISWPDEINRPSVYDGLVDFSDFMPTFADLVNADIVSDGRSLLPLFTDEEFIEKESIFMHYDPRWGANANKYRNQFARTKEYKLYQDGKFYYLPDDVLELFPLPDSILTEEQVAIKNHLQELIDKAPQWK